MNKLIFPTARFSAFNHKFLFLLLLFGSIVLFYKNSASIIPYPSQSWTTLQTGNQGSGSKQSSSLPDIPSDYAPPPVPEPWCEQAYGHSFLQGLRDNHHSYCKPESSLSQIECFTSPLRPDQQTFCVAKSVLLIPGENPLKVDCTLRDWDEEFVAEDGKGPKPHSLWDLPKHMFDTGPGNIVKRFMSVSNKTHALDTDRRAAMEKCAKEAANADDYQVLVLRDPGHGSHHWHSMWEIVAFHWTVDVLRISARGDGSRKAYWNDASKAESQVVLLDDDKKGDFWDMWRYFTGKEEVRMKDIKEPTCLKNVLIPLPGGANPLWYGDHSIHNCHASPNLRAYSNRVLSNYHIQDRRSPSNPLTVTVIERHTTRQLRHFSSLVDQLRTQFPAAIIRTVDFGSLPSFADQLQVAAETDVLVGVHGAGLAMQIFMPPGSAVVELLPAGFTYDGYRNLARLRDHGYFGAHCIDEKYKEEDRGWQLTKWVEMEEQKWLTLVGSAMRSMYNRREMAFDIA